MQGARNLENRNRETRFLALRNSLTKILLLFTIFARLTLSAAQPSPDAKPELVLQTGHADSVWCVAFSPDGRWLASGSEDHSIKLWDLTNGLEFRTLAGHSAGVVSLAFSPDGRFLASSGADLLVRVWDWISGLEIRELPVDKSAPFLARVHFSSDGQRLSVISQSAISENEVAKVWNTQSWELISTLTTPKNDMSPLIGFSPDGRSLAIPVDDAIGLYDLSSGLPTSRLHGQHSLVADTIFSPDGKRLASENREALKVWDLTTNEELYSVPITADLSFFPEKLAFSPDGKLLAFASDPKTLSILDASTGQALHQYPTEFAHALAFSADGRFIAGVRNAAIVMLDVATGRQLRRIDGQSRSKGSLLSEDARWFVSVGENTAIKLWDFATGRGSRTISAKIPTDSEQPELPTLAGVSLSADGTVLAAMDTKGTIKVFETAMGRQVHTLSGVSSDAPNALVNSLAFSPDGRLLAVAAFERIKVSNDKPEPTEQYTVNLIDVSAERGIRTFSLGRHYGSLGDIAFSSNGRLLTAVTYDSAYVWDVKTGNPVSVIALETGEIPAFSPDGQQLAIGRGGAGSNLIDLFDVRSGKQLRSLAGHNHWIYALRFSPDGRWLASGSYDQTVKLWDVSTGRELRTFAEHSSGVNAISFSKDGKWLVSASYDGSVRFRNTSTMETVAVLAEPPNTNEWVVATADGLFDGSSLGTQKFVAWRVRDRVLAASQYYNTYSTPGLLAKILSGSQPQPITSLTTLKLPPAVHLFLPIGGNPVRQQQVTVNVEARDEGGGIAQVRLYQNGKLVASRLPSPGPQVQYSFEVTLLPGQDNTLKALALGNDGVESTPDEVTLFFEAPAPTKSALYVLVIGINDYADSSLHLEFAQPDAKALGEFFRSHGQLFSSVNVISLFNSDATKAGIQRSLDQLIEKAKPEDVVLIYFAGHGVLVGQQFYFLPQDIKKEADAEAAVREFGLPASVFGEALVRVKAVKQVLMLDACQSESALPTLAKAAFRTRGFEKPEDRAVRMLAHANGVYLIAASTAQQYAYEVPELGHGLFTYALLSGLGEHAEPQAMNPGGTVTVLSLINYVARKVPELTEKYHMGEPQVPVMFDVGTDIPLLVSQTGSNNKP